jgi:FAD/FMN-containing dehydrogenase/Fe-S oxidoreductase
MAAQSGTLPIMGSDAAELDAAGLADALHSRLRGEVRFDSAARALYATDGSNYRHVPIGVVFPHDNDDVIATLEACRQFGAPLLSRGAGTSLAGQCCNVAVVVDFSRHMNAILEIDPVRRIARVQPGVVLDSLRNAAEQFHLTFAPDPASHDRCTLGGMIGNNSCGVHSVMAGKTDDNIDALDIVTYDGTRMRVAQTPPSELARLMSAQGREAQIYRNLQNIATSYGDLVRTKFPNIPRRVSGYNLNWLLEENGFNVARSLVGSEGTCVTVLEATCRLAESPPQRVLLIVAYPDIYQCADHIPEILEHKPIGLEGFDDVLVGCARRKAMNSEGLALLPEGGGWLLVEFGADSMQGAEAQAQRLMESLNTGTVRPNMRLLTDPKQARRLWEVRESSLGVTSHVEGEPPNWEGWEDSAVAPENLGAYLRDLRKLMVSFGYKGSFYGHFGHACVHTRINFDLLSKEGVAKFRQFMEAAADLVVSYGGSLSGEHGDGQARAELLPKMFGPELMRAFSEFKSAWDPDWKMNPGKLISPNKLDENLRLGASYAPWQPQTNFAFSKDNGSLAEAALRCVGVGKCLRDAGGVMCPSYRVTREEEHSTRGRAHLLWEMTKGEVIRDGWRSHEVKQSLDLCLSCKGCKSDCPVGVDVATYKSEFLSHHYEGHIRPRSAYAFGYVDTWARLGSHAPMLANFFTQTPLLRDFAKFAAGVAPGRSIPRLAPRSFKSWFERRRTRATSRPRVLLWPDTFNNYFLPATAQAAVEVLEYAGFEVVVPRENLCCGRPLYDFGMLDRARALLLRILDALAGEIAAGTPVVGLEPSCVSVFRDELCNLFPDDERAQTLSRQTFLLSEFLETRARHVEWPRIDRQALLHGHCHQKSIMKMTSEESMLQRVGVDFQQPAPGCCGMAGAFGFEREKYELSMAIGQLELLPAVARAPDDWLIVADGFSCREQIAQASGRPTLHLAEVLKLACAGKS